MSNRYNCINTWMMLYAAQTKLILAPHGPILNNG